MVMPFLMDNAVDNTQHLFKELTAMQVVVDSYTDVLQEPLERNDQCIYHELSS